MALHEVTGDVEAVRLHGELDASTALGIDGIVSLARQARRTSLVLDFSDVTFLDSHGLRAIVRAQRDLAIVGCHLLIQHPRPGVRRFIELTGADTVLDLRD